MNAPHLKHVLGSAIFDGMSPADIEAFNAYLDFKKFVSGASIFLENMEGEYMYLLLRGTVKLTRMLAEGNEQILVVLGPEDAFGELALFDEATREATARVVEEAHLAILSREKFNRMSMEAPALALRFTTNVMRTFSQRVRETDTEYRQMIEWALDSP